MQMMVTIDDGPSDGEYQSEIIPNDLNRMKPFLSDWQPNVNVEKCQVLHFGHRYLRYEYFMNDTIIPIKMSCKDLGGHHR